jgi:hypothetical protein
MVGASAGLVKRNLIQFKSSIFHIKNREYGRTMAGQGGSTMPRNLASAAISLLAVMALCACGEKSPRQDPEGPDATANHQPQNPLQQRAQTQNESERIGN